MAQSSEPTRLSELLPAIPPHIAEVLALEAEEAREAGAIGYMARVLVQATMPHSRREGASFQRSNGLLTLTILTPPDIGLPYGSIPRLLLVWVTTEAVRTRDRRLVLGHHLSDFMRQLDLVPTGGRWGTIPRLRTQMLRLFASSITCVYADALHAAGATLTVAADYDLWWNPKVPNQGTLWQSTITLGERFFAEIIERPVPIDLQALQLLRRSPLALDVYIWLTHRMSYLRQPVIVPWEALQLQFGAEYSRLRDFRSKFLRATAAVLRVYPQARVSHVVEGSRDAGLRLEPSPTHVRQLRGRSSR